MRTYIFEIKLLYDKKIAREIEIREDAANLEELKEAFRKANEENRHKRQS